MKEEDKRKFNDACDMIKKAFNSISPVPFPDEKQVVKNFETNSLKNKSSEKKNNE